MSGPVDVLAVMEDAAHAVHIRDHVQERVAILDARDAVAELIEADKEYDRIRWLPYDRHDPIASREAREQFIAAQERRAAALARVQGGAA